PALPALANNAPSRPLMGWAGLSPICRVMCSTCSMVMVMLTFGVEGLKYLSAEMNQADGSGAGLVALAGAALEAVAEALVPGVVVRVLRAGPVPGFFEGFVTAG